MNGRQMESVRIFGRRDERRQHQPARKIVLALALGNARLEPRGHIPAFAVKSANIGDVEERAILGGEAVCLAYLFDQRKGIAQAAGKNELGILAPLDPALDE